MVTPPMAVASTPISSSPTTPTTSPPVSPLLHHPPSPYAAIPPSPYANIPPSPYANFSPTPYATANVPPSPYPPTTQRDQTPLPPAKPAVEPQSVSPLPDSNPHLNSIKTQPPQPKAEASSQVSNSETCESVIQGDGFFFFSKFNNKQVILQCKQLDKHWLNTSVSSTKLWLRGTVIDNSLKEKLIKSLKFNQWCVKMVQNLSSLLTFSTPLFQVQSGKDSGPRRKAPGIPVNKDTPATNLGKHELSVTKSEWRGLHRMSLFFMFLWF